MKLAFLLMLLSTAVERRILLNEDLDPAPPSYSTLYIEQRLDHFNSNNDMTWREKYLISDVYWEGSGPLFFYAGNEDAIEKFYNNTGFLFTLAEEFKALVVFAEHRYYGESLPFGNESFTGENLGYLTVKLALEDYAILVQSLRIQYPGISKVIAFGGSYGGMLSAWFRFNYPYLVDGALASSAPILDHSQIARTAYYQIVTESFAAVDEKCPRYVREGFSMIDELASQGEEGLAELSQYFRLCNPLKSDQVIDQLKSWIKSSFTSLAMHNYPHPSNFETPLPAFPVRLSCEIILGSNNRAVGLAQGARLSDNGTHHLTCLNITSTECKDCHRVISWNFQACTEIWDVVRSNNVTDMFPPKLEDTRSNNCTSIYGVRQGYKTLWNGETLYRKRIILHSERVAPINVETASNIIFSNGDLDPWSSEGLNANSPVSDSISVIVIKGGAHHVDLRFPHPNDPLSLIEARSKEREIIKRWIQ